MKTSIDIRDWYKRWRRQHQRQRSRSKTSPLTDDTGPTLPKNPIKSPLDAIVDNEWQINLLPYRALRRTAENRRFAILLFAAAVFGLSIVIVGHVIMVERLDNQNRRNEFLSQHISVLETQITDIKNLRSEINATISRKHAVETLQANRSLAVQVLNQLLNPPLGIHYTSIKEDQETLTVMGLAGSNAQISQLMTQLDHAAPLTSPKLIEIHAVDDTKTTNPGPRMNAFTLVVTIQDSTSMSTASRSSPASDASSGHPLSRSTALSSLPTVPSSGTKPAP